MLASASTGASGLHWPRRTVPAVVTAARAPASRSRTAMASAPKPVNSGSAIAPSWAQAYRVATYTPVIGRNTATASPGRTPSRRSSAAIWRVSRLRPAQDSAVWRPLSSTPMTAGSAGRWAAQRRRQLSVSANSPPVNQVAHSGPRLVSSTAVYGTRNSIPRSATTASQNHSGSFDLASSSSAPARPCRRASRVTAAAAIRSSSGHQAACSAGMGQPASGTNATASISTVAPTSRPATWTAELAGRCPANRSARAAENSA